MPTKQAAPNFPIVPQCTGNTAERSAGLKSHPRRNKRGEAALHSEQRHFAVIDKVLSGEQINESGPTESEFFTRGGREEVRGRERGRELEDEGGGGDGAVIPFRLNG